MKIRALRVREVGCLGEPVALEGMSGGLDVLAGPNELGKSTLFRALDAVFGVLHTSKSQAVGDWMVPDMGGAPVIEVDFETGGGRYRLRKQYFSAARASLVGLDDRTMVRGADAEERLAELLVRAGGANRLGLLWVGQTKALEPFTVDGGTGAGLKGLIERELSAAAGGQRVHAVRQIVRQRLGAMVSGKLRKPRGDLKEALDRQAGLARESEQLQAKLANSRTALDRLGELRVSHAGLTDAVSQTQRSERIAAARGGLETARAASEKRRTADEAAKRLQHETAAAAAALATFDARAGELVALAGQLFDLRARHTAAANARSAALDSQDRSASALALHMAAERDLRTQFEEARRAAVAGLQRNALSKRLAEATGLSNRIADLRTELSANRATAEVLQQAEEASRVLEAHGAKTVRIELAYDKGAQGRIIAGGKPLSADTTFDIDELLELTIAGIGRIRIVPQAGAGGSGSQLVAARAQLDERLAEAGAPDVEHLRAKAAWLAAHKSDLGNALARFEGLCPEGLDALQSEIDALGQAAPLGAPADVGGKLAGLQDHRNAIEADHRTAQAQARQAELTVARLESEVASLEQRHARLMTEHPEPGVAAGQRASLQANSTAAAGRAQQALLELSAHRASEPDPEQLAIMQRELIAAITAETAANTAAGAQAVELSALQVSLRRDALDGIGERLAECEGELSVMNKRLATLNREMAALELLEEQFAQVAADTSARYLLPVTERLAPYLALVLPGAELRLGDSFAAQSLLRAGRAERLERLSDGTREQIAVLVRLGLARLLADTGEPIPLILDDALVFSDDARIAASFAALRAAAAHHQVIVLTCRATAFEALGGKQLALTPWQGFSD